MRFVRVVVRILFVIAVVFAADVVTSPHRVAGDLHALATRAPSRTSYMREAEARGESIGQGRFIGIGELPAVLACGVMFGEEPAFFVNGTIDYASHRRLLNRLWQGDFSKGGSGIAQQLARNLFLSGERTIRRKAREYALAYELTHTLSKSRQLELYLNVVEWGPGVWGVDAASRHYFGVAPTELSPTQAVILATLLPAPRQSLRFATSGAAWPRLFGITYGVWSARLLSDTQRAVTLTRARLWQDAVRRGATPREAWEETLALLGPEPVDSEVRRGGPELPPAVLCSAKRRGV